MSDPIPFPVALPPIPEWPLFISSPDLPLLDCPDECEIRFWPAAGAFALWHEPSQLHAALSEAVIPVVWPAMAQFMRGAVFGWRNGAPREPYRQRLVGSRES